MFEMNGDFFVVFYIVKRINNIIKRKRGTSFLNFLFFCDPLGALQYVICHYLSVFIATY